MVKGFEHYLFDVCFFYFVTFYVFTGIYATSALLYAVRQTDDPTFSYFNLYCEHSAIAGKFHINY